MCCSLDSFISYALQAADVGLILSEPLWCCLPMFGSLTRWKMAHCAFSYMCLVILTCFPQFWSTWWICLFTLCVFFIFSIKLFDNLIHLYNIIWSHSPHPTPSLLPFSLVLWPTGFNQSPHEHRCEAVCWRTENLPVATLLKTMTSPGVTNTQ